jgi:ABC-type uncharacterized transport system involved in gliding motility auxiliary subunit
VLDPRIFGVGIVEEIVRILRQIYTREHCDALKKIILVEITAWTWITIKIVWSNSETETEEIEVVTNIVLNYLQSLSDQADIRVAD